MYPSGRIYIDLSKARAFRKPTEYESTASPERGSRGSFNTIASLANIAEDLKEEGVKMFFRSLCPTVMLASVHSGVVYSSYGGKSAGLDKKVDGERDEENQGGPRELNEDAKPVPSSPKPIPSSPKAVPCSTKSTFFSPSPIEEEEEDKENRPTSAGGVGRRRESRTKSSEVHRSRASADNNIRSIPTRCLSPMALGAHRALSLPKAKPVKTPSSPLPIRGIRPLSNIQNMCPRSPAAVPRGVPTSHSMRSSRRDQKPCQRSPLRITKSAMTLSPNQKLSIVYRHDRFFWDAKEVDTVKGY